MTGCLCLCIFRVPNPLTLLLRDADMTTIDQTQARLNTHEEVCALRYEGLCARLKRLEGIGIAVAGAIIMLLVGIIVKLN